MLGMKVEENNVHMESESWRIGIFERIVNLIISAYYIYKNVFD
jgi:hypothetical protein